MPLPPVEPAEYATLSTRHTRLSAHAPVQLALRAQTGTRIRCQRVPHYEMLAMILQAIQAAVAYITINNTHYLINSAVCIMIFSKFFRFFHTSAVSKE